jgi:hypothetical protein
LVASLEKVEDIEGNIYLGARKIKPSVLINNFFVKNIEKDKGGMSKIMPEFKRPKLDSTLLHDTH